MIDIFVMIVLGILVLTSSFKIVQGLIKVLFNGMIVLLSIYLFLRFFS